MLSQLSVDSQHVRAKSNLCLRESTKLSRMPEKSRHALIQRLDSVKISPNSKLNDTDCFFPLDFPHCFSPWCYRCQCPPQLEGPDCQQMRVSFLGNGYAWFPPIRPCFDSHLSLEFMTEEDDGLLLYAGPMATLMPGDSEDYMAIGKERVCIIRCVPRGLWAITALKPAT